MKLQGKNVILLSDAISDTVYTDEDFLKWRKNHYDEGRKLKELMKYVVSRIFSNLNYYSRKEKSIRRG